MVVRELKQEDFPIIDACMRELHSQHVQARPDLYGPVEHPVPEGEFLAMLHDPAQIAVAVVSEDDTVLGFGTATVKSRSGLIEGLKTTYVDDLFVRREYRRQGIATLLFRALEERAKTQGAQRLDLMVWEFNEPALAFYRSLGMTPQRYILEKKL